MAVIWQHQKGSTRYEVRSAGHSLRLHTDGVFHSQFNPNQPVSGGVWDLLFLPVFFRPPDSVQRVLVLGVGGGAVVRQIQHFLHPREIVGVELERVHLREARRFFGVRGKGVKLVHAEAREWLHEYRGAPFDLIVDDLFGAQGGEPVRAVAATPDWFAPLNRLLTSQGVLTMNFPAAYGLRSCGFFKSQSVRAKFAAAYQFTLPLYENVIGAFLKQDATRRELHRHLSGVRELDTRKKTCRLRFGVRRISGLGN